MAHAVPLAQFLRFVGFRAEPANALQLTVTHIVTHACYIVTLTGLAVCTRYTARSWASIRQQGGYMAKPIRPTPPITGEAAREIQRELRDGTPNTPQRLEIMKQADEVFQRSQNERVSPTSNR